MKKQTKNVLAELELLDDRFREEGIPDEFSAMWGVDHNVGIWIIGRDTAEYLHKLVLEKKPKRILEIGSSIGYSTIWLADAAQEVGAELVSIEKEPFKVKTAHEYLEKAGIEGVELLQGEAEDLLQTWEKEIDLLFLDANKRSYLEYLKLVEPHLNSGAVIVADNVSDMAPMVQDFLEYISNSQDYDTEILDLDHGVSVSVKKKNSR